MDPFPPDAPRATLSERNPAGLDSFEFVEFAHPEPERLRELFSRMGDAPVARHRTKAIELWQQGDITHVPNDGLRSHARRFAEEQGHCAPSMSFGAWRMRGAPSSMRWAVAHRPTTVPARCSTLWPSGAPAVP